MTPHKQTPALSEAEAETAAVRPAETGPPEPRPATAISYASLAAGWLIPGAGHALQGRWIRALLLFLSVTAMFLIGVLMQGKIYSPNTGDILDILGFIGDLGAGGLYFLGRILDWGRGAIQLATADYGTKFIIVAGLLNVITAIDAYDISIGKKS